MTHPSTISFITPTILDINAAIILGVSVKTSDNPIGYFGTGLKFAIATLLRTGHSVDIYSGQDHYSFYSQDQMIRDQLFHLVQVSKNKGIPKKCGFTTDLGKNWTVEMAYRELHSNTMDEQGEVVPDRIQSAYNQTSIIITGPQIGLAYSVRHKIFLNPDPTAKRVPIHKNHYGEIYTGESFFIYYRGVIGLALKEPLPFTINITQVCTLSEDRFIKEEFYATYWMAHIIKNYEEPEFHNKLLDSWETSGAKRYLSNQLDVLVPSRESTLAKILISRINSNHSVPQGTSAILRSRGVNTLEKDRRSPTEIEHNYLTNAVALLTSMSLIQPNNMPPVYICNLPSGVHALADLNSRSIYLSPIVFENGVKYVASTLYEEYLHIVRGFSDETRALQSHLFETIFTVYENATGKVIQ